MKTEEHDRDEQTDAGADDGGGLVDRVTDDETPVGDTPEAHDELSPHDIPKSHPAYGDVVRQAEGSQGTTSGTD